MRHEEFFHIWRTNDLQYAMTSKEASALYKALPKSLPDDVYILDSRIMENETGIYLSALNKIRERSKSCSCDYFVLTGEENFLVTAVIYKGHAKRLPRCLERLFDCRFFWINKAFHRMFSEMLRVLPPEGRTELLREINMRVSFLNNDYGKEKKTKGENKE